MLKTIFFLHKLCGNRSLRALNVKSEQNCKVAFKFERKKDSLDLPKLGNLRHNYLHYKAWALKCYILDVKMKQK